MSDNKPNIFDQARATLAQLQQALRQQGSSGENPGFEIPYAQDATRGEKTAIAGILRYAFKGVAALSSDPSFDHYDVYVTPTNYDALLDEARFGPRIDYVQESLKNCWRKALDAKGAPAWKRSFLRETPEEDICKKAMGSILAGLSLDWSDRVPAGSGAGLYVVTDWSGKNEEPYAMITGPAALQQEILAQFGVKRDMPKP